MLTADHLRCVRLPELTSAKTNQWVGEWLGHYYARHGTGEAGAASPAGVAAWWSRWAQAMPALLEDIAAAAVRPVVEMMIQERLCAGGLGGTGGSDSPGITRLVLSPHRGLHVFPLHACRLVDGRFLGDAFEVGYTPSLSLLHLCAKRQRPAPETTLLAYNPTGDLPFTEAEGSASGARFGARATSLRGPDATRERLLREAPECRVWHYSGHSAFNPLHPLETALILGVCPQPWSYDWPARPEWLTLRDTFTTLNLRQASLAILNGCESGMLRPEAADDYVNLPTGFLYAGAPCVISTLWSVNDLSSALVMVKFHEFWDRGRSLGPAAALRAAARWLREEIQTKQQLEEDILPPLLAGIADPEAQAACEAAWGQQSKVLPEKHPFASPIHWAPFIASGWAF